MTGIIPAAGLGTRMASITNGKPKELMPLGSKRILERVIDEAREAMCDRIIVVSSESKPQIQEFLERFPDVDVVLQARPGGLGDAIATPQVEDDALILLGDCCFIETSPAPRLAEIVRKSIDGAIALELVDDEEVSRYGIAEANTFTGQIQRLVEKPKPTETESRYAIAGRYAFGIRFMTFLLEQHELASRHQTTGEIGFTEIIQRGIAAGFDIKGVPLQPNQQRVDSGSPEEYMAARQLPWD